jgi:sugar lactone lactonase YvrE
LIWQGIAAGNVTCAPTIALDGSIYVGSTDGYFHGFNADGTRRWPAVSLGDAMMDTSAAALAPDGTIYFGSGSNSTQASSAKLHAYNSVTGAKKWEAIVGTGVNANNAVALAADGTIIHLMKAGSSPLPTTDQRDSNGRPRCRAVLMRRPAGPDGTIYLGCDDTCHEPVHRPLRSTQ